MTHWQTGRYFFLFGITILFLVHGFGTIHLPLLDQLESVSYDFKVRRTAPDSKDSRIVIVDIDEKSQAALGPWPWPRDRLARLVDTLFEHYRIGVLGFDMVFSEADLSSGLAQLESLAKGPLSQDSPFLTQFHKLRPTLDRDRIFAISLRDRPVILGFNFLQTAFSGLADMGKLPLPVITLREIGNDDVNSINAVGYLTNIGKIQDSASGAGFIDNPAVSQDGVVRRVPLLQNFNGALYQSLPLGIIRTILGDPPLTLGLSSSKDHNAKTGLEWISLGPHKITVDSQGAILIPFRGKQGSFPYFSAVDVMERGPEKQALDAAIVLVGVSSVGNARMLAITPVQKGFPSVEIHANIISGILDGTFKSLPGMSPWPDVLLLGAIGVIFSILLAWIPMSWRFVSAGFLIVLLFIVNIYLWQSWDLHLSLATPITLIVLLLLTDTFFEVFGISPKRDKLHVLYGRHVSRALMDEIIRTGRSLAASGEQREMTVITSTVKDFSKMAKNLSSKDLSQWLHGFLTPLTEVIHNHRGTLDHYHGESIVAFWGAPVEDLNHGRSAVMAVMEMVANLGKLEDEFQMRGWPVAKCAFAVQTGTMTSGVMGSEFCRDFKALGEPVQQAQWFASLASCYGVSVIVGEKTKAAVPDMIFRELDKVIPDGADDLVSIYEPVGFYDRISPELRSRVESFHVTVAQFRRREWDLAEKGLKNLLQQDPEDRLYEIYLTRIRRFRKFPPAVDWNGICPLPRG